MKTLAQALTELHRLQKQVKLDMLQTNSDYIFCHLKGLDFVIISAWDRRDKPGKVNSVNFLIEDNKITVVDPGTYEEIEIAKMEKVLRELLSQPFGESQGS